MSTVKANTYQDASGGSNAVFSGVASPPNSMGNRNRIINGDMRIDQRYAGATVTITNPSTAANNGYVLDRFYIRAESAAGSKISTQRSTTAPAGFTNSQLITSLSAYSIGASEHFGLIQAIEGFNCADLDWGTASAQAVTLSFKVRSSLTGTFGGFIANSAADRCYIYSYTISAANTWETKTITIPGDTTGTWLKNNDVGIYVSFGVAAGSSVTTTAGTWGSTLYRSVTGQTSLVGTNGATFYITGVQLEAGTNASAFERRDYGRELMMCQRYYQKMTSTTAYGYPASGVVVGFNTTSAYGSLQYLQQMRAAPTISTTGSLRITDQTNTISATLSFDGNRIGTQSAEIGATVSSGCVQYRTYHVQNSNDTTAAINLSAEL